MKTKNKNTWAVELQRALFYMNDFVLNMNDTFNEKTYMVYDPSVPYLYLPENDFFTFRKDTQDWFSNYNLDCEVYSGEMNSCAFFETCDSIEQKIRNDVAQVGINLDEVTYDFTIGDEDGEAYTVAVPFTDFLLPG